MQDDKKRIKVTNKRPNLEDRIKKALAKKPTSSYLNNQGITAEVLRKNFATGVPVQTRKKLNVKGRNRRNARPATSVMHVHPGSFVPPTPTMFPMDEWFQNDQDVDVSIIVPMYRSHDVIQDQINSWDLEDDGLTKEIIYVNDGCPNQSYIKVIKSWEQKRKQLKAPVGKIVLNDKNGGFPFACNTGAKFASGKYLIFLNADCVVTLNWIKPMVDLVESNKEIGIVGNLQIKGDRVDSAGSEWDWNSKSFVHIGRGIYHGKRISKSFLINELPSDLQCPQEREMVTGCCFLIPKELFYNVEGFDLRYRIGYWEDADLCMRVRSNGYKVFFTPDSRIHHQGGHSKSCGHYFMRDNYRIFADKWLHNGRIDSMVGATRKHIPTNCKTLKDHINGKVVGCVIACNEEEFLEVSVDSIAKVVDEWVFVIGGNNFAYKAGMCGKSGLPNDNTLEIANKLADKYNGTVIEPPGRLWKDKVEMRNAYVPFLKTNDWMFMLDGDEVYKEEQLYKVAELTNKHEVLIMQFWLFWNDMWTNGTGTWGNYPQERLVHWKEGYGYRKNNHLNVSNASGKPVNSIVPCWRGSDKLFYHYSWVRPVEKIRQKLAYYKYQSGNTQAETYVDNVFLKWRKDQKSVQGKTHPMGGGGTEPFQGIHPAGIHRLIEDGMFNFND
jgi:GT2 family glycosyltransferase